MICFLLTLTEEKEKLSEKILLCSHLVSGVVAVVAHEKVFKVKLL